MIYFGDQLKCTPLVLPKLAWLPQSVQGWLVKTPLFRVTKLNTLFRLFRLNAHANICYAPALFDLNPFTATHTKKIFWSNNRTAFAQYAPAATTKYVRISTLVVCGVSSRVLLQPLRWRHDFSGFCARNSWSRSLVKACTSSWDKDLSIDALEKKIRHSYKGLYLPGIQTSMYIVTVSPKLLGHVSYSLRKDLVHCKIVKK